MIAYTNLSAAFTPLMQGAIVSLEIAFFTIIIGIVGGTLLALILMQGNIALRTIGHAYISLMRGTPMLVQMMTLFFLLPLTGIMLPAFWTAVLAIGMNSIAYVSNIIKAGIQSVSYGQIEAATTLGFSRSQISRLIVLPQAFRTIFPALDNECITLIKDTSLASVIGVAELNNQASLIMNTTYDALTAYIGAALMYLLMTSSVSLILYAIKRKTLYVQN